MSGDPMYSEQEAEEILRLASQSTGEGISQDRLLKMADELGLSPEAVESAAAAVRGQRTELAERKEFEIAQRRSFFNHLMSYVIVNLGLIGFNLMDEHRISWAIWVILGWGIGIAGQASQTFFRGSEGHEKEFQKWRAARAAGVNYQFQEGPKINASVRGARNSLSPDILSRVENIALRDNLYKLEAIKRLREESGLGLREAKDVIDEYERQNPGIFR